MSGEVYFHPYDGALVDINDRVNTAKSAGRFCFEVANLEFTVEKALLNLTTMTNEWDGTKAFFTPGKWVCFSKSGETIILHLRARSRQLEVDRKGVAILFEDRSMLESNQTEIITDTKEEGGYFGYSASMGLSEEDEQHFLTKKMIRYRLNHVEDSVSETFARLIPFYISALKQKP